MEQHILLADCVENRAIGPQRQWHTRHERWIFKRRPIEACDRKQRAEAKRAVHRIDIVFLDAQIVDEQGAHNRAGARIKRKPHHQAKTALAHALLHRFQQIVGLIFFDLQISVACDAEAIGFAHGFARKQQVQYWL